VGQRRPLVVRTSGDADSEVGASCGSGARHAPGVRGGVYSYTLNEEALVLTAEEEPCELRRALLERTWTVSG
jgi:hypothetical protein